MSLLLSITFLGFYWFFPLLKQHQIHLDESGMLQPIHQLLYIEQTAENGILLSHLPPICLSAAAPHEHSCRPFPCALAGAAPALGADGWWSWGCAACALQRSPSDPGGSCPALQEHKANCAALLHPASQSHSLGSLKISIWLGISQNRHLYTQGKWEQQKII